MRVEDVPITWCNLPNGEPGIVVWYWNEYGEITNDVAYAVGVTASDRYRKWHSFKIEETTFDEVALQ